jgi:hemicentin
MINQTLSIRCEASGIPQPQITWHFDGVPFATAHGEALAALDDIEREYEMGEGSAEFRIQNVSREHQGRYSCLAVNKAGRAEADIFVQIMGEHLDLTLKFLRAMPPEPPKHPKLSEPPQLRTPTPHVRVVEGKELSLSCEVLSGVRPLEASWQKGETTLATQTEENGEVVTNYLHIPNAQQSDAGVYLCEVKNSAGKSQLAIKVDVLGKSKGSSRNNVVIF